jgi:hypothetical protein
MLEGKSAGADRRRERRIAAALLCALVLWRTSVFLLWPQSHFDSDQAVFGLMAKHLSELRAFPLFMYGQSYILAVEAWMAAPLFAVFGASALLLKLPLVFVNFAVVLLLLRLFERESGLRPLAAAVPILFFALPAPGTSNLLLEASGGNLEPFLYVILIWITRHRPNLCGLVLGVGFLHREFTIYALAALLAIETAQRTLFTRGGVIRRLQMLRTAAEVWIVAQFLKPFASAAGPGSSLADLQTAPNNIYELFNRTCVDPLTLATGAGRLVTSHLPRLFGMHSSHIADFSIVSSAHQGLPGAWILFAGTAAVALAAIAWGTTARRWHTACAFPSYLLIVGLLSMIGYVAGRCGDVAPTTVRYELLSLLGATGLGALALVLAPAAWLRRAWIGLAVACAVVAATGHARLSFEYATKRPIGPKEQLVQQLEPRGIQYGYADYWVAYYVTFLTNERVIVASSDLGRIKSYVETVAANRERAVRISRHPCDGGRHLTQFFFMCPLP